MFNSTDLITNRASIYSLNDPTDHSKCSSLLNIKTQQDFKSENRPLNYEIVTNLLKNTGFGNTTQSHYLHKVSVVLSNIFSITELHFSLFSSDYFLMVLFTCVSILPRSPSSLSTRRALTGGNGYRALTRPPPGKEQN